MFQTLYDAKKIKSAGGGNYAVTGHSHKFKKGKHFLLALEDDDFRQHIETLFHTIIQASPAKDEADEE
jgi:hypothetical protein